MTEKQKIISEAAVSGLPEKRQGNELSAAGGLSLNSELCWLRGDTDQRAGRRFIMGSVAIIIILVSLAYIYVSLPQKQPLIRSAAPPSSLPSTPSKSNSSLGGKIYEQSKNPIQNKVPVAPSPTVNPIQNVYKNPF